jgi:predicted Rossmann fold nucleotide-binding protein DprA/Smf involved in DNA uptake
MKVAVIGSRTFKNYSMLKEKLDKLNEIKKITCIVSGGAEGADSLGARYADENNIKKIIHEAQWSDLSHPDALIKTNSYGKKYDARAGFRRNYFIIDDADIVIAFQISKSSGTQHSIDYAKKLDKPIKVFEISM